MRIRDETEEIGTGDHLQKQISVWKPKQLYLKQEIVFI